MVSARRRAPGHGRAARRLGPGAAGRRRRQRPGRAGRTGRPRLRQLDLDGGRDRGARALHGSRRQRVQPRHALPAVLPDRRARGSRHRGRRGLRGPSPRHPARRQHRRGGDARGARGGGALLRRHGGGGPRVLLRRRGAHAGWQRRDLHAGHHGARLGDHGPRQQPRHRARRARPGVHRHDARGDESGLPGHHHPGRLLPRPGRGRDRARLRHPRHRALRPRRGDRRGAPDPDVGEPRGPRGHRPPRWRASRWRRWPRTSACRCTRARAPSTRPRASRCSAARGPWPAARARSMGRRPGGGGDRPRPRRRRDRQGRRAR